MLSSCTCLLLIAVAAAPVDVPELTVNDDRIALAVGAQRATFDRSDDESTWRLATEVRTADRWRRLFSGPVARGASFDLEASACRVAADEPGRKAVVLEGVHPRLGYPWDLLVEADDRAPLLRFRLTCRLEEPLLLEGLEPVIALWLDREDVAFQVDQGPTSIYGDLSVPHNYGFPAAYVWDDGVEAATFFNMTPAVWFSDAGVMRFNDVRIMTASVDGRAGLGMHLKKRTGDRIEAGDIVLEWYLYSRARDGQPSKFEALDTMIRAFASLHPADSVLPERDNEGGPVTWRRFAERALTDLMHPELLASEFPSEWRDQPLELIPPCPTMLSHSGGVWEVERPEDRRADFSLINNHLTPWILFTRLHGGDQALHFAQVKKDNLPRFYDPRAGIIRHGTREPAWLGDTEMSWQNFFFHFEMLRVHDALPPNQFNPAIAGRVLMALDGLIELAHNVDYVFPQWFDPYEKRPLVQNDVKRLGVVYEPWQAGTYAYLMVRGYEMTGEQRYLDEARAAIDRLLGDMRFRVTNEVYDRTYDNPVDFPVTELFGPSFGVIAASKLARITGDPVYREQARKFLNVLLRLTPWYEDETDPVSRDLRSAGLFYPHGGASVVVPWETHEANVGLVYMLRNDEDHPVRDLLLRLTNLIRINGFYFHPAVYSEGVRALDPDRRTDIGQYFPIEPFYCLEGKGGHRGPTAAYMANFTLWNYWIYEALATADDPRIMALNTDLLETFNAAIAGLERTVIAYNPTDAPRTFRLRMHHLPEGSYRVDVTPSAALRTEADAYDRQTLDAGLELSLAPLESARIRLRHVDADAIAAGLEADRSARDALAHAYQVLQDAATDGRTEEALASEIAQFADAMARYRSGAHGDAERLAKAIVQVLAG